MPFIINIKEILLRNISFSLLSAQLSYLLKSPCWNIDGHLCTRIHTAEKCIPLL